MQLDNNNGYPMKSYLAIFILILLSQNAFALEKLSITVQPLNSDKHRLIADLLSLSLSKVGYKVSYIELDEEVSDARMIENIRVNQADLMWAGMSEQFETELLPVRIPIFKGILGHRIFVIPEGTQSKFNKISNLQDLQSLEAGQGRSWGDTKILEAAGLPTIKVVKNESMWYMIDAERFDYFPLALHEPWSEIKSRDDLNLKVEENILLIYPFAMYFYVNLANKTLYSKIYEGMNKAIEDGSYDKHLFSSHLFKSGLQAANISQRKVIRIGNPFMSRKTPVDIPHYWLDVENFSLN